MMREPSVEPDRNSRPGHTGHHEKHHNRPQGERDERDRDQRQVNGKEWQEGQPHP